MPLHTPRSKLSIAENECFGPFLPPPPPILVRGYSKYQRQRNRRAFRTILHYEFYLSLYGQLSFPYYSLNIFLPHFLYAHFLFYLFWCVILCVWWGYYVYHPPPPPTLLEDHTIPERWAKHFPFTVPACASIYYRVCKVVQLHNRTLCARA